MVKIDPVEVMKAASVVYTKPIKKAGRHVATVQRAVIISILITYLTQYEVVYIWPRRS